MATGTPSVPIDRDKVPPNTIPYVPPPKRSVMTRRPPNALSMREAKSMPQKHEKRVTQTYIGSVNVPLFVPWYTGLKLSGNLPIAHSESDATQWKYVVGRPADLLAALCACPVQLAQVRSHLEGQLCYLMVLLC